MGLSAKKTVTNVMSETKTKIDAAIAEEAKAILAGLLNCGGGGDGGAAGESCCISTKNRPAETLCEGVVIHTSGAGGVHRWQAVLS